MNSGAAVEAGVCYGDNMVTHVNAQTLEGKFQCIRAVRHADAMLHAYVGSEFFFEQLYFIA
ncbi:hypothetical protein AC519_1272 [Pseudomonas savastanoi]|nr:hypothetical protein AC519_1272 [Pseudomonas savastanoi]